MGRSTLKRLMAIAAVAALVGACTGGAGSSAVPPTAAASAAASAGASSGATAAASAAASNAPAAATCAGDGSKGSVKLMINQWVGAQANVAVVQCLLQQMGYKVATNTLAEEVAWQGFDMPVDLVGYQVQASDGRIGTIDETSDEADAGHLVVDTGPWIFGQKVLLPAGTVDRVDHQERVVHVDRTRQQIKDAPPFDPDSADHEYRERVGAYYADSYLPPPGASRGYLRPWSGRATAHPRRSTWSTAAPLGAVPEIPTSSGDGREQLLNVLRAGGLRFRAGARWRATR